MQKNDAGNWNITNMGALMIAKDLRKFDNLHRRTVRVIWYKSNSRLEAINNSEVRKTFGLSEKESFKSSRIIKDTAEARLIKGLDETTAPRYIKYIPSWA